MKKVYLFDIDGTLTPPRQKMDESFAEFFLPFAKENIVYLATGSDIEKAREQVDQRILMMCQGVFTCSGNEFWERGKKVYSNEFYPRPKLVTFLEKCVKDSNYHTKTGNHLEYRNGMLNFSVVGRNATPDQRAAYVEWDERKKERWAVAVTLLAHTEDFGNIDVSIGGEISIDIYPKGKDKSQAVSKIRQLHGLPIVFMGDRMEPNGNDYPAAKALKAGDAACQVENWKMTELLIRQEMEN
tara:strand:- start:685 stop:1407 length:723 start_codon:yes stop_codon:yes gene_type:complete